MPARKIVPAILFSLALPAGISYGEGSMTTKFDIPAYQQRMKNHQDVYTAPNGNQIQEIEVSDGFVQKETETAGLYIFYREFHKNGVLKREGKLAKFGGGDAFIGSWNSYNSKGKLTGTEDHERGFKISYEQVLEICRKKGVNLNEPHFSLARSKPGETPLWYVSWDSGKMGGHFEGDGKGIFAPGPMMIIKHISIDGVTGTIKELPDSHFHPEG
jgi:hypothetical protein